MNVDHAAHHQLIEDWIRDASQLFNVMDARLDAIEQRLANIEARVSEWEVGPR